jgi:error-prone DNA polymerase
VTLDDPTGPIDVTVFERAQDRCARTVFHSWLLLIRGELRKRGGASRVHRTHRTNTGITVVVEEAFDLAELARDRAGGMAIPDALDKQRARWTQAGVGSSADGKAGDGPARSSLWHSSGGSAGR